MKYYFKREAFLSGGCYIDFKTGISTVSTVLTKRKKEAKKEKVTTTTILY